MAPKMLPHPPFGSPEAAQIKVVRSVRRPVKGLLKRGLPLINPRAGGRAARSAACVAPVIITFYRLAVIIIEKAR